MKKLLYWIKENILITFLVIVSTFFITLYVLQIARPLDWNWLFSNQPVTVTVCNSDEQLANGSTEIWITKAEDSVLPMTLAELFDLSIRAGTWEYRGSTEYGLSTDFIVSYGNNQGNNITFNLKNSPDTAITFLKGANAGTVKVTTQDDTQIFDLQTDTAYGEQLVYHPFVANNLVSWAKAGLAVLVFIICLPLCFAIAFLLKRKLKMKSTVGVVITNCARYFAALKVLRPRHILFTIEAVLACSYVFWLVHQSTISTSSWLAVVCYAGAVVLISLFAWLVAAALHFDDVGKKAKIILWLVAAGISVLTVCLANTHIVSSFNNSTIEIWCGKKNSLSNNAEMWLREYTIDGTFYNVSDLTLEASENIHFRSDYNCYLFDGSGAGYLRLRVPSGNNVQLKFIQSAWSGIIMVSQNRGPLQEIDLYRAEELPYYLAVEPLNTLPSSSVFGIIFLLLCYACLLQIALYALSLLIIRQFTKKRLDAAPDCSSAKACWFLFASGILLPVAILLFLFTQNANYVRFPHILILGCAELILFAAAFWTVSRATGSRIVAYIACITGTIFLYGTGYFIDAVSVSAPEIESVGVLLCGAVCALLMLGALILFRRKKVPSALPVFALVFTGMFFVFNLFSSVSIYTSQSAADKQEFIKNNYVVDPLLVKNAPNIYWIHCDGMLGFASMEKFYGDEQTQLKDALYKRGFTINETAQFEAGHSTSASVAALMCPDFYDADLGARMLGCDGNSSMAFDLIAAPDYQVILKEERWHNETITAFANGGYHTAIFGPYPSDYYPPIAELTYTTASNKMVEISVDARLISIRDSLLSDNALSQVEDFCSRFIRPLRGMTKNSIFNTKVVSDLATNKKVIPEVPLSKDPSYPGLTQVLNYILNTKSERPYFYIFQSFLAHTPFDYNEDGVKISDGNKDVMAYPAQHKYAGKVLLKTVDVILDADPNAVIVLQADHGLHGNTETDFIKAFGEDVDASDLWNQVFSAVRIPENYQNGDEHYALSNPLNISRYLVNSFVGTNYSYLP